MLYPFGPLSHPGKNDPWVHLTKEAEAQGGNLLILLDRVQAGI